MGVITTVALGSFLNAYIFASPLIMQWLVGRYVIHMYYDEATKTYTATTLGLFMQKREHQFTRSDVVVPDIPKLVTSVFAKGKPLLLEGPCFLSRQAHIDVMKYDEPIDFLLRPKSEDKSKS